jgi:hypothetical protein
MKPGMFENRKDAAKVLIPVAIASGALIYVALRAFHYAT